jgi:hypothetical protein
VYVNGRARTVPPGVGVLPPLQLEQTPEGPFVVGGAGFYWLHTHDTSGVIHIESPVPRRYTLGDFFDVWGQPLSQRRLLGFAAGPGRPLTVFVNGRRWHGGVRTVPLRRHASIVVELGRHVARHPVYLFSAGQ